MRVTTFDDGCGFTATDVMVGSDWQSIITKLDGWYEGTDTRTEKVERLGDGIFPVSLLRGGRPLTLAASERFRTRAECVARARQVSAVFRSGEAGHGTVTVADPDLGTMTAELVALDGRPKVVHDERSFLVEWELPLMAADPHLYGTEQAGQIHTVGAGVGLVFPFFDDDNGVTTGVLEFGATRQRPLTLTNYGNATAYPRFEVIGDFPTGFRITMNGCRVEYIAESFSRQPVTVDMSGSVTVGGSDRTYNLSAREWVGIDPGRSASPELEPLGLGEGYANVTFRSRYL